MKDWREINRSIAEDYETRVPDYNLKPVLELIAGVEPQIIATAMVEAIISLADELLIGYRRSNLRSQELMSTLKMIYRAFNAIQYNRDEFNKQLEPQIVNEEGCYAEEPMIDYPMP